MIKVHIVNRLDIIGGFVQQTCAPLNRIVHRLTDLCRARLNRIVHLVPKLNPSQKATIQFTSNIAFVQFYFGAF